MSQNNGEKFKCSGSEIAGKIALFLTADNSHNCGVSDYVNRLIDGVSRHGLYKAKSFALSRRSRLWRDYNNELGHASTLVLNFPIVAWKPLVLEPSLALIWARLRGRRVTVILHEWQSCHVLRRCSYVPALLLANQIVMMSELVRRELAENPILGQLAKNVRLVPLPPNIERPMTTSSSPARQQLMEAKAAGRMIIGSFGSIYPGKQPVKVLQIAAALKDRGHDPLLVFVGSVVKGTDSTERDMSEFIAREGMTDNVMVTGYVETPEELFGIFECVDAFVYDFAEGMTARRASVLACLQSRRPVLTTAPVTEDEFQDHPRLAKLVRQGLVSFVPIGAPPETFATALENLNGVNFPDVDIDVRAWWDEASDVMVKLL